MYIPSNACQVLSPWMPLTAPSVSEENSCSFPVLPHAGSYGSTSSSSCVNDPMLEEHEESLAGLERELSEVWDIDGVEAWALDIGAESDQGERFPATSDEQATHPSDGDLDWDFACEYPEYGNNALQSLVVQPFVQCGVMNDGSPLSVDQLKCNESSIFLENDEAHSSLQTSGKVMLRGRKRPNPIETRKRPHPTPFFFVSPKLTNSVRGARLNPASTAALRTEDEMIKLDVEMNCSDSSSEACYQGDSNDSIVSDAETRGFLRVLFPELGIPSPVTVSALIPNTVTTSKPNQSVQPLKQEQENQDWHRVGNNNSGCEGSFVPREGALNRYSEPQIYFSLTERDAEDLRECPQEVSLTTAMVLQNCPGRMATTSVLPLKVAAIIPSHNLVNFETNSLPFTSSIPIFGSGSSEVGFSQGYIAVPVSFHVGGMTEPSSETEVSQDSNLFCIPQGLQQAMEDIEGNGKDVKRMRVWKSEDCKGRLGAPPVQKKTVVADSMHMQQEQKQQQLQQHKQLQCAQAAFGLDCQDVKGTSKVLRKQKVVWRKTEPTFPSTEFQVPPEVSRLSQQQFQQNKFQAGLSHGMSSFCSSVTVQNNCFKAQADTFEGKGVFGAPVIRLRRDSTNDRIALLRQLVAPDLQKGDTATVLAHTINFLKAAYLEIGRHCNPHSSGVQVPYTQATSLSSKGLCLVPLSAASNVAVHIVGCA
eukprot:TRINITY_DN3550_c0_g1_i3.p1 TRINITY_DN3550_c0_g1~~TRINITY_DN3550_c0_g1_i3.p1  ORF type:complete len:703 (-),score=86.70 TRINITY_DN3550_c0_g1_i3:103-2211(-)